MAVPDLIQKRVPISDVNAALDRLKILRCLLRESPAEGYQFAVKEFPIILKDSYLLEDPLEEYCENVAKDYS